MVWAVDMEAAVKKRRSPNFDFKDMKVLTRIVATLDPHRVITSSSKDAGTLAQKRQVWDEIVQVSVHAHDFLAVM